MWTPRRYTLFQKKDLPHRMPPVSIRASSYMCQVTQKDNGLTLPFNQVLERRLVPPEWMCRLPSHDFLDGVLAIFFPCWFLRFPLWTVGPAAGRLSCCEDGGGTAT